MINVHLYYFTKFLEFRNHEDQFFFRTSDNKNVGQKLQLQLIIFNTPYVY